MEEIMKQKHIGIRTILLLVLIAILALVPFWIKTPYILGIFVTTFYPREPLPGAFLAA